MVEVVLISLALISGIMAFFGPCGIAMLPAYVAHIFGLNKESRPSSKNLSKGLFFGLIASLGIISVYLIMGIVFSYTGTLLKPFVPLLGFIVGIILVSVGIILYFEKFPYVGFPLAKHIQLKKHNSFNSFYLFGVGYGIAQLSCTLPIFLLVVFEALAVGSFVDGMLIFLIYGMGIGLGIVLITIGSMVSIRAVQKYVALIASRIREITALVLLAAGLYQIYFQIAVNNMFALFI